MTEEWGCHQRVVRMLCIDLCGPPLLCQGPQPLAHTHKTGFLPGSITAHHMFCTGDVLAFTPALEMSKNEKQSPRQHHTDMEECLYLLYAAVC